MEIIPNRIYKHFKGDYYIVIDFALHSETKEKMVIYRALYGSGTLYARPLSLFAAKVNKDKYPNILQEYVFELQDIESVVIR